jgi:hypothetical protein
VRSITTVDGSGMPAVSAITAAVLSGMTASCKRHGIDPFRYLADVYRRFRATRHEWLPDLLTDVWFLAHPQAARNRTE